MSQKPINPNNISRLAEGTVITGGNIKSEGDFRFDGEFAGEIFSKSRVIVGEHSKLSASIKCDNLDVWGNLEGDVLVRDTMTLKAGASYRGHIASGRLVIELGASFEGDNRHISEEEFEKSA